MGEDPTNVVRSDDRDWSDHEHDEAYDFRRAKLGEAAGREKLGCSLHEVPPGKRAWPYHYHEANEEAIYVLDGRGTLRTPDGEVTVEPGDYVALPTGEGGAHQLRNDGEEVLRYLAASTMCEPDVLVYPDSRKVGVYAGAPPGESKGAVRTYLDADAELDYWDRE